MEATRFLKVVVLPSIDNSVAFVKSDAFSKCTFPRTMLINTADREINGFGQNMNNIFAMEKITSNVFQKLLFQVW